MVTGSAFRPLPWLPQGEAGNCAINTQLQCQVVEFSWMVAQETGAPWWSRLSEAKAEPGPDNFGREVPPSYADIKLGVAEINRRIVWAVCSRIMQLVLVRAYGTSCQRQLTPTNEPEFVTESHGTENLIREPLIYVLLHSTADAAPNAIDYWPPPSGVLQIQFEVNHGLSALRAREPFRNPPDLVPSEPKRGVSKGTCETLALLYLGMSLSWMDENALGPSAVYAE
ncbi:hypothetical protein B0J13DRAFT_526097 [Dactylonectria estremocensis]|uniref:Uncharacterized protein n=1 Tax=Dactylonectria estremocensis TaxID=1079267 RepID=A0A9P9ESC1_9HYPO|nr:hypothetical protein B0J13DRAFT_526097 [Dactylonectria estremocensis]